MSTAPASAAIPTPPQTVDAWAWCGVNPDDPGRQRPCVRWRKPVGSTRRSGRATSPRSPTRRQTRTIGTSPDIYMRLVQLNATVGMKTIVYDERLWYPQMQCRGNRILDTRAVQHRRDWATNNPDGPEWTVLKNSVGVTVRRRTGDGRPAVRQLPANHPRSRQGAHRSTRSRTAAVVREVRRRQRRQLAPAASTSRARS